MIKRSLCLLILIVLACSACATGRKAEGPAAAKEEKLNTPPADGSGTEQSGREERAGEVAVNPAVPVPEFVPVSEDLSPLKTRIVSVSARSTPLKDILFVVAEATGLNVVMDAGVNPELPVTLTLKNVSAEDALNMVSSSAGYFYSVKGNVLTVKALETRMFEFGQPSVIQDYAVNVGGDILGGSSGSTGGGSGIKGSVSQSVQSDKDATKLWDSIEKTIGNLVGATVSSSSSASASSAPAGQDASAKSEQPSINVNRMTGTIVVTAAKKDLEKVEDYLTRLKKILGRQVIIEARVVEVQLSDGLKYGIDWTSINALNVAGTTSIGTSNFTNVLDKSLPSFNIGVTRNNFNAVLTALNQQGNIKTLSNPRVNIMNGQTALLSVGRNTNFISKVETTTTPGSSGTAATTTFSVTTQNVLSGVMIGMAPIVNENGEISMAITPIISDLVKLEDRTVGTVGQNTIQISLPTVDLRELNTTVKIKDGEMVIIGGLIQNRDRTQDNQVPFLGRIPIVGYLFKSREMINEKTELVIMLKPTVVVF